MRLLYISWNGFPAATSDARGTFSLEHANALRELGVEVDAVDTSRAAFGHDRVSGLDIHRLPRLRGLLRRLDWKGVLRYARFFYHCRYADYDAVVLSFFYLKYLPFILWLRRRGRAVLVIAHGGEVMPGGMSRALLKRWMFNLVDVVTPVSDFTEAVFSCLIRRRRVDDVKIVTIYNGVDPDKLRPTASREEIRRRIGIDASDFVVLSVCNLVRRKGLDMLVRAIDSLAAEGRPLRHVIIGRGPERDRLDALAARNGRGDRFTFIDAVESSELADYYEMADIFALVSVTDWEAGQVEGFGITYAEAMALGKPVVGGGGSGTTTTIKHGFTGLLVDPHRSQVDEHVAAAVRRFMDDVEFRRQTEVLARRHVAEQFSWRVNAERTKAVIEGVLNQCNW